MSEPSPPLATDERLNPEFKAKWLNALRSGTYIQTKSRLRSPENCFCCLGVACDLLDPKEWSEQPRGNYGDPGYDWGENMTGDVGVKLDEAIGLPRNTSKVLSEMNDNQGATFSDIANWIEANL